MQYLLIHTQPSELDREMGHWWRHDAALTTWLEETVPAGVNLQGSRLRPSSDATTVRIRQGELLVSDGPFAETKEQIAGYDVLECADYRRGCPLGVQAPDPHRWLDRGPAFARRLPANAPSRATRSHDALRAHCRPGRGLPDGPAGRRPRWGRPQMPGWKKWTAEGPGCSAASWKAPNEPAPCGARAAQLMVTDGPFAETKEQIAGFDVLECADLDEALEVAAKHPMAKFGMLELRPFWDPEEP